MLKQARKSYNPSTGKWIIQTFMLDGENPLSCYGEHLLRDAIKIVRDMNMEFFLDTIQNEET